MNAARPAGSFALLRRTAGLAAPFASRIALGVTLGFCTIASSIGLLGTSAYIIASAALHPSIAELQVAIVGVRFFGISRGVFRYLERNVSHQVTLRLLSRLRVWFYRALEPLAPARLLSYRSGDLLNRAVSDIESLENIYVRVLAPPLVAMLVTLLSVGLLAAYDSRLAWTLLLLLLLAEIGVPALVWRMSRAAGKELVTRRSEIKSKIVDGIQGLPDLLAFGRQMDHLARLRTSGRALAAAQDRLARAHAWQITLESLLSNLGVWLLLIIAIPLVGQGNITGVSLAVLLLVAGASFEAAAPLSAAANYLSSSLQAARRLFDIVDARPAVQDPPAPQPIPAPFGLTVSALHFRYAPEQPLALAGVDFNLPAGRRLAIVGPSGAGKSTLVNLLLRFWPLQEGQILVNGRDVRQFAAGELRQQIAVVSQHTHLFNASVRQNLLLAKPSASQAELEHAARIAQIDGFIHSLPQGYETWIGELGAQLSGGQRQRLAIARALLKNAPLLILDEATANLDALTEKAVLGAIHALMNARTTLMITHRLVAMEQMDEILVLDRGQVVERGTHRQLLAAQGSYRRMWELQNQLLMDHLEPIPNLEKRT